LGGDVGGLEVSSSDRRYEVIERINEEIGHFPRSVRGSYRRWIEQSGGSMQISLTPIGVVRTHATENEVRSEEREIEGELEIFEEFGPALEGIDGYSHLFVISYFDQLRDDQIGPLQVRPRRLVRKGLSLEDLPLLGVFALDSPTRPNPIGLSLVRLLGRAGTRLSVKGLDCFDGTPILDVKGYQPDYRPEEFSMPDWYQRLMDESGHI
jgi:tRNA (adenine37-N6)-methyltransferase